MVEGNRIKFGYGDVAIGSKYMTIIINSIKPPQEVGTKIEDKNMIQSSFSIILDDWVDILELTNLIKLIKDHKKDSFEFKGYVFDYSNYNEASIKVLEKHLSNAISLYIMTIAA